MVRSGWSCDAADTRESLGENQPASLDGRFWIAADARLDGGWNSSPSCTLRPRGSAQRSDSELILHAYATWARRAGASEGRFFLRYLDGATNNCLRAGSFWYQAVYYVQQENLFLFSNTMNCVRMHPEVSGELNDAAIGTFCCLAEL